jgi:hypothetical protein
MSSWKGRTTISGEWRSCNYDGGMIVRYLEDVVAIMISIADNIEIKYSLNSIGLPHSLS